MSASNEKPGRGNFQTFYKINGSTYPAQLNWLACDISRGKFMHSAKRSLFELFLEPVAGAYLADRVPLYTASGFEILAVPGNVTIPPAVPTIGRAFE